MSETKQITYRMEGDFNDDHSALINGLSFDQMLRLTQLVSEFMREDRQARRATGAEFEPTPSPDTTGANRG